MGMEGMCHQELRHRDMHQQDLELREFCCMLPLAEHEHEEAPGVETPFNLLGHRRETAMLVIWEN